MPRTVTNDFRAAPARRAATQDTCSVNRSELLARTGCLTVIRPPAPPVKPAPGQPGSLSSYVPALPEVFVAIVDDGRILAFNGHVDLGTGIRTSLAQIVAEELDVPAARVTMVLGDTAATPNQGPTIASATIQISAAPLRCAAAQARHALLALAAERFGVDAAQLRVDDGTISAVDRSGARRQASYAELVAQRRIALTLDPHTRTKDPAQYRIVGRASPRVDLPAKATGELTFVHDVRVPGMLHGRVVRPPYAGHDSGPFVGASLLDVDRTSVADVPGLVAVVTIGDFVGVVAEREEHAIRAARQLRVVWRPHPPLPPLDDPAAAIAAAPAQPRLLLDEGDVEAARTLPDTLTLTRTYTWPFQMHASIGPSCAVADYRARGDGRITVWSGTQNPVSLRYDLATLVARDEADIDIVRMEAAGCYGRNGADDVCGDALLLSRAVGRPVRVQLMRADEHLWEPKGAGQQMRVTGTVSRDGRLVGYDFATRYPSNDAPLLAALLTGTIAPEPRVFEMGDRTAVSPYVCAHRRFVCEDLAPLVRASWLRGVSALPNSFAHDAFVDECAALTGVDPLAFRIRHLQDARDRTAACRGRTRGLEAARAPRSRSGARRTRARHRVRALRAQPLSRFRRGVVRVDRGAERRSRDRRDSRRARDGRTGHRHDDQSGRRAPSDSRQCDPGAEPHAEGARALRGRQGRVARMGELSDPDLRGSAGCRRRADAATGRTAARCRRIGIGAGAGRGRERAVRRDRRAVLRAAFYAGNDSRRTARRRPLARGRGGRHARGGRYRLAAIRRDRGRREPNAPITRHSAPSSSIILRSRNCSATRSPGFSVPYVRSVT